MNIKLTLTTLALASLASTAAHATEGGGTVVPIGVQTIATGLLQEPGDYLLNYNQSVTANKITDARGNSSLPNAYLSVAAHSLRYLHVFDGVKIAGADLAFEVATAYVDSSLRTAYFSGKDSGIGDTSFGPSLGWHSQDYHQMVSLLLVAPTGSYDKSRNVNVGRNYYALQADYAMTWFFARGWELSAMLKFVFNAKNNATNYKSGIETDIDYALNYHFSREWFAGIGGYAHNQLTDDTLNGVSYNGGNRVRDLAIGPQIGWGTPKYGAYLAWQHQTTARNTAKGDLVWLNAFYKFD